MKLKRKPVVTVHVVFALLAVTLSACTQPQPTPTPTPEGDTLPWQVLAAFPTGRTNDDKNPASIAVITTADEAQVLQGQVYPEIVDQITALDFSVSIVIAVFQGWKGSTGYSVEVTDVQQHDNTITVYARFHEPGPNEPVGALVTSPYSVFRAAKTENMKGDFTFVLVANGIEVARQNHTIP